MILGFLTSMTFRGVKLSNDFEVFVWRKFFFSATIVDFCGSMMCKKMTFFDYGLRLFEVNDASKDDVFGWLRGFRVMKILLFSEDLRFMRIDDVQSGVL